MKAHLQASYGTDNLVTIDIATTGMRLVSLGAPSPKGEIRPGIASIESAPEPGGGTVTTIIGTPARMTDRTNWEPGHSAGIRYYTATVRVVIVQSESGPTLVGLTLTADGGEVVCDHPPVAVTAGTIEAVEG